MIVADEVGPRYDVNCASNCSCTGHGFVFSWGLLNIQSFINIYDASDVS